MQEKLNIMIVDDEMIVRESFLHWFEKIGHRVATAASGAEALEQLEAETYDLLFVDIKMPEMNGIELLQTVKKRYPETLVIIITAYGSIESAVEAMKLGATDYLLKPFRPDQLNLVMEKILQQRRMASECAYLKGRLENITRFDNIIGRSPAMEKVYEIIAELAPSDTTVLLVGETGTGKELIAKAIHAKSSRSRFPFIAINCGAVPDSLIESELFGHKKGSFTGAVQTRKGYIEIASGGTLFLDEIGEISLKMQVDLLRVLEEKTITRIGNHEPIPVDFRLISATSRSLQRKMADGAFRKDFFYRINVVEVSIPPLRDRREDIALLVDHFLDKYCHETTKHVDRVSPDALALLRAYDWPGNVRELENAMERAVVLSRSRTLSERDFSFLSAGSLSLPAANTSLQDLEKRYIQQVLEETGWNVTRAAQILGINRVTLHKKLNRYRIERPER